MAGAKVSFRRLVYHKSVPTWKNGGGFIMLADKTTYEPMLRQTERDLAALENERVQVRKEIARLQRGLKDLATRRTMWVRAAGSLKQLLELPLSEEETELCGAGEKESLPEIPQDAFKEMALPEAAKKFLTMLGRPATHSEVVESLRTGGVNSELKHLNNSVRSAMQRRPDLFVFVKQDGSFGEWELAEWSGEMNEVPTQSGIQKPRRLSVVGASELSAQSA